MPHGIITMKKQYGIAFVLAIALSAFCMTAIDAASARASQKEYTDQELAVLAAKTPEAGAIVFNGSAANNSFTVLHPQSNEVMGEGFMGGGRVYVDFRHSEHKNIVERVSYQARVQGKWLIMSVPFMQITR